MMSRASLLAEGERLLAADELAGARQAFKDAVSAAEVEYGAEASEVVLPLWWLSKAHRADQYEPCEQLRLAIEAGQRAVRIAERAWSASPADLADLLTFHGITLWLNGQRDDALTHLMRAETLLSDNGLDRSGPLGPIVEVLLDAKKPELALPHARDLVHEDERTRNGSARLHSMFLLADCLRQVGPADEARTHIQETISREKAAADANPELITMLSQWLSEVEGRAPGDSRGE